MQVYRYVIRFRADRFVHGITSGKVFVKDYLGAHMSISGGLHMAIDRALAAGCGVVQIFTRNSNQWRGKPLSDSDVQLFRENWRVPDYMRQFPMTYIL